MREKSPLSITIRLVVKSSLERHHHGHNIILVGICARLTYSEY
jgi:hypothetical protein